MFVGGGVLDAPQSGTSSLTAIEHIPLRLCTIHKRRGIFLRKKSNKSYKPIDILGKWVYHTANGNTHPQDQEKRRGTDMDWNVMVQYLPQYEKAAWLTLRLGVAGIFWAILVGLVCAVLQYEKVPVLRRIVGAYIQLSRNTPLLVQLFFLYYGLPKIGIKTNAELCGIAGLAFLGGSYMAEAFRSGLEAIEPIQTESALSLGMSRLQTMRYVVLPQAVSISMPAFMANIIFLLKETSVFSAISLMDLMFTAKDLIGLYYKTAENLFLLVVFYLIILLPVSLLGSWLERRVRYAGFGS